MRQFQLYLFALSDLVILFLVFGLLELGHQEFYGGEGAILEMESLNDIDLSVCCYLNFHAEEADKLHQYFSPSLILSKDPWFPICG